MATQLRLFTRKAALPSKKYFKNANTMYEKSFNKKCREMASNYDRKQNFLKNVLKEWKNMKYQSKLNNYMAKDFLPLAKRKVMNFFKNQYSKLYVFHY